MNPSPVVLAAFTAVLAVVGRAAPPNVPLAIDFPKALHHGTPIPIRLPKLEPIPEKAPQLQVPAGTSLLSKGKPVTSSDPNPIIGELALVTDGDKTGFNGTVVELSPGLQWVQIDLGAPAVIHAIAVWHFHAPTRAYHDVIVRVSHDPAFGSGVTTLYNNDDDNSAKVQRGSDRPYIETHYGRLIAAKGVQARYVRLYSNGNTSDELNQYCEVEVYGTPARR